MASYREDLELWADNYFLENIGLTKRKTFGKPAYYLGKKMFAFVYDDGIVIKAQPATVKELLEKDPNRYKFFNPGGDAKMKNWVLIVRSEDFEYEDEIPLIEESLEHM
ncbi:MAG: MmcQ/YjbR family DNA-binding protein [Candidatus Gracilibacteria bacterium]